MNCRVCGATLEFVSHGRYGGLRFPESSLFRCAEHGPVLVRREAMPGPAPGPDAPRGPGSGHPGVRVPLTPRPTLLAGAVALPEPDDDDHQADRVAGPLELRVT
jgi:hypothetical protein